MSISMSSVISMLSSLEVGNRSWGWAPMGSQVQVWASAGLLMTGLLTVAVGPLMMGRTPQAAVAWKRVISSGLVREPGDRGGGPAVRRHAKDQAVDERDTTSGTVGTGLHRFSGSPRGGCPLAGRERPHPGALRSPGQRGGGHRRRRPGGA